MAWCIVKHRDNFGSFMHTMCSTLLILLDFIPLRILGEKYKLGIPRYVQDPAEISDNFLNWLAISPLCLTCTTLPKMDPV